VSCYFGRWNDEKNFIFKQNENVISNIPFPDNINLKKWLVNLFLMKGNLIKSYPKENIQTINWTKNERAEKEF
jgi:hypothetical protein